MRHIENDNTTKEIRFDDLPNLISELYAHQKEIMEQIKNLSVPPQKKEFLSIEQLHDFLPNHPSIKTIYRWMNNKIIPFYKGETTTVFLKSDIEEWLQKEPVVPDWWHERDRLMK